MGPEVLFCLSVPRPRLPIIAIALGLLVAAPSASALEEQPAPLMPTTEPTVFSPTRVIVQWASSADHGDKAEARAEADVTFKDDLGNRDFQLVKVEPGQTAVAAVAELEADPAVAVAERDGYRSLDAVPNDPLFDQLWGLRNLGTGINGFTGAVAGYDVNALAAWDRGVIGSPTVVVADIDSGYRFEHPDLAAVAWNNPGETANGLDDDGNGIVDDLHGADFVGANGEAPATDGDPTDDDLLSGGHGVHTAGTIGAAGNNGVGITGVAQDARIMPLRVCSRFTASPGNRCPFSSILKAINYAGAEGARIANMSLGGNTFTQTEVNAIAANPGVLYVISAGNDGSNNDGGGSAPQGHHYPCDYRPTIDASPAVPGAIDNIVCVAATDQADGLADFSDWGADSVDLAAPGTETLSSYPFVTPFADQFNIDDFAVKWPASGANGGFQRTKEAPLTSFGMTDVIGAPAANTVRETTSAAVSVPANGGCKLTQDRRIVLTGGGHYRYSVLLNGSEVAEASSEPPNTTVPGMDRRFLELPPAFNTGGSVQVRFRFTTGPAPDAGSGVWLDGIVLSCSQAVGQASAYAYLQGTSMAAPHVSGAAGLLFSSEPAATVTQVRNALLAGVDAIPSLTGLTTTGGRLDIPKALDSLEGIAVDNVAPAKPILSGTVPGGGNDNNPEIKGSAEAGAIVTLFNGFSCAGKPIATGTAAELAGTGIGISVPDNSITFFTAAATDGAHNRSSCSSAGSYLEDTPPPAEGGGGNGGESGGGTAGNGNSPAPSGPILTPPAPITCKVPKLAGLSLAKARAALAGARCTLGKVTQPKARKGHKLGALVVKSSSPAAGAAASGAVNLTLGPKPKKRHH
jgi:subtilisin family serine protease